MPRPGAIPGPYSAPARQMKIHSDRIEKLLDQYPVARLATSARGNRIHLVPIVYVRHQGALWSPVDGKPKSGRELVRVRNIRLNPAVSVLIDHYDQDWSKLWWIRIDGKAKIVQQNINDKIMVEVTSALTRKYPQYRSVAVLRDPPTLIAVHPLRTSSWCIDNAAG